MKYSAICLAAGNATRFWDSKKSKAFILFNKQPIIKQTLSHFISDKNCTQIIVTLSKSDLKKEADYIVNISDKISVIEGGSTRAESSFKALKFVDQANVIIHDVARPFFSKKLLNKILNNLKKSKAVIPVCPITFTIKEIRNNVVAKTLNRNMFYETQTPQGFSTEVIKDAYKKIKSKSDYSNYFDDSSVVEKNTKNKVTTIPGEIDNIKITYKKDLNEKRS